MNYMKQVAEMLGVELGEEFNINELKYNPHKFENEGMMDCEGCMLNETLRRVIIGELTIEKLPWVPKEYGEYYRLDIEVRKGYTYGGCAHVEDVNMMKSRGMEYYKTEAEAQERVKELGWNID